ncbi:MAG: cytochrome P450 [Haloarculaceae archaeon]
MDTETGSGATPSDGTTDDRAVPPDDAAGGRSRDLPLPPHPPNLGHPSLHVLGQMRDVLAFAERAHRAGDVVRTRRPAMGDDYHLAHPEHAKRVLLTERERFRKSEDFRIAFGEGLLTVEGEEWKHQREALRPLFTRESVHGYADGMVEQIARRSRQWADGDRRLREAGVADSAMLTDERLRDQMVTVIFAGHDTTTTTLTFGFWALANHPEVRERFHEEVDGLDGPPTVEDLDDLEVTERVITETLRLYPPVYTLPRVTAREFVVDGYRIPADERVFLEIRRIQRDPRFFDAPTEFRPSRWDGDLRRELHDFAYAPFGGGPRICIGREFALLEAKLALATIGQEYELYWIGENEPDGEPPVSPEMTLRMAEGQEFLVTER